MTETTPTFDGLAGGLSEAAAALSAFASGPAREAAESVSADFAKAGERIARALAGAVDGGEAGFKRLAKVALEELAKIAIAQLQGGALTPATFLGARAAGGAVNRGGAYLVGERGPEWFTPASAGRVEPFGAGGGVTVNFHFAQGADADGVRRHQGQIAAQIARAVAYGRRNL